MYGIKLVITHTNAINAGALSPIIVNGDAVGSIIIFSTDSIVDETDFKIAQIASKFLSKNLE